MKALVQTWLGATAALLVVIALGCSTTHAPLPRSPAVQQADNAVHAGVAEGDITPPPGLSLFGHGPEARVSAGMLLRLRCQAFVLASGSEIVALVPCDLAAPDMALQREVARRLTARQIPIGGDRLYLMATHTHAGPAHYFTPRRYSGSFSSYQPGFDPKVVDFLAARITGIVAEAYAGLAPACIGWNSDNVYGLTRNRSYPPFAANFLTKPLGPSAAGASQEFKVLREAIDKVHRAGEQRGRGIVTDQTELRTTDPQTYAQAAVDPTLSVLRIDKPDPGASPGAACNSALHAVEDSPLQIGLFAVFGMHPTGVPNTNDLYHGDIFGFATREVEMCIGHNQRASCLEAPLDKTKPHVVVGLANGIEGDVSPAVDFQSPLEARRIARELARRILQTYDAIKSNGELSEQAVIAHAYRELRFPDARVQNNSNDRLCPRPSLGTAAAGGAEDGPTRFRFIPEFNEGRRLNLPVDSPPPCHGEKLELIPPEGPATDDGLQFPAVAPIAIVQIGKGYLATAPAELTTVTGVRIRETIEKSLSGKPIAVIGLTNSYLQYVATREEYRYQNYEGASTLYGPNTSLFLAQQFGCLASWMKSPSNDKCKLDQPHGVNELHEIPVSPGPIVSRFESDNDDLADPIQLSDVEVTALPQDGVLGWAIHWSGPSPSALAHRERLAIQIIGSDGSVVADDQGPSIELRHDDDWRARWLPDCSAISAPLKKGLFRFFVKSRVRVLSKPFSISARCVAPVTAP